MGIFDFLFKGDPGRKDGSRNEVLRESELQDVNFFEEYAREVSPVYDRVNAQPEDSYSSEGVQIYDTTNTLRLVYDGLLAESGAQDVFAVVGYGNNIKWEDVSYHRMNKIDKKTFELLLPVKREENINIAFKDSASNWDNNSGLNYSFTNHFKQGG